MEITAQTIEDVSLIVISGDIDGKTAPIAQEQILPFCQPGSKVLLDMTNVAYMSSAGLRLLLLLYRQVARGEGRIILVGLTDELKDTMSATGFLSHFTTVDTRDDGLAALK